MANLFEKAKSKGTVKAVKPAKKEVVISDKALEVNIARLANVQKEIASLTAESTDLTGQIKPRMIEAFIKIYNTEGVYPGSFNLKVGKASLMVVPTDKYIVIDEDRASLMKKQYGPNIIEEKDTYILDTEMVEKYGAVISKMIEKCKDIPEGEKEKLIKVVTVRNIKKGTIQKVFSDFKKFTGAKMSTLIEDIKPVFQMKGVRSGEESAE